MGKLDKWTLIGLGATVLGVAGTVLSGVVDKKQMDQKISEEVAKKLAESSNK